ncbi:MAG: biotin/lipoyl-binding protein, partial [Muribaculaceae bacterium]|nr:biotin/lipoyl-binding protein [Muribaculaceae bacterium]
MVTGGGLALSSCKGDGNAQQQQAAPTLATLKVSETDADLNTTYPATLHGKNDVEIRPQISGFLTKVHVQEGQKVSAGQLLFTI